MYTLDFALALGTSKAGIADLRAQLVDTSGSNVGSALSTGFTEIGNGNYLWHYASIPDSHRGGVKFYSAAASSTILGFAPVNPEEAENVDAKITSRMATYTQPTGFLAATFPTTVASTTNITAGTITTTTNLTNAPTAGDLTATMKSSISDVVFGQGFAFNSFVSNSFGDKSYLLFGNAAAIKAKTDNLPSDPADASDIATSFGTVNTTLATIAGYIDTEVAAIKAKTDNLPSDPADASDIASAFGTVNTTLGVIAGYIDTEVSSIKTVTDHLATSIELDSGSYRFTTAALANAPSASGGGSTAAAIWAYATRTLTGASPIKFVGNVPANGNAYGVQGDNISLQWTAKGYTDWTGAQIRVVIRLNETDDDITFVDTLVAADLLACSIEAVDSALLTAGTYNMQVHVYYIDGTKKTPIIGLFELAPRFGT